MSQAIQYKKRINFRPWIGTTIGGSCLPCVGTGTICGDCFWPEIVLKLNTFFLTGALSI